MYIFILYVIHWMEKVGVVTGQWWVLPLHGGLAWGAGSGPEVLGHCRGRLRSLLEVGDLWHHTHPLLPFQCPRSLSLGPRPAAVEALVLYSGGRVSRGSGRGGVVLAHHRHGIDHLWVRTAMANECEDIGETEGDGNSWAYHCITILSGTVNSHNVLVTNHRIRERRKVLMTSWCYIY